MVRPERRMFIVCQRTKLRFLIDTGSEVSIIPRQMNGSESALILFAANNSPIGTFGQKLLTIDLGLRREFVFPFIVADLPYTIIGADFFGSF